MEENPQQNIYDNYKFVTRKELSSLGMEHLIGTNVTRPYMHGFFIDLRLYEQAKAIANPFAYVDYRERRIKERLEKERESRIRATKKLPKVNKELANRLTNSLAKKQKGGDKEVANALEDPRFKELFTDQDYEIDKNNTAYKLLHPTLSSKKVKESDDEESEGIPIVESESDERKNDVSTSSESEFETDSDKDLVTQARKQEGTRRPGKRIESKFAQTTREERQKINKPRKIEMKTGRILHSSKNQKSHLVTGNIEMTFKNIKKKSKSDKSMDNDLHKDQVRNRRSASKNVFRRL